MDKGRAAKCERAPDFKLINYHRISELQMGIRQLQHAGNSSPRNVSVASDLLNSSVSSGAAYSGCSSNGGGWVLEKT